MTNIFKEYDYIELARTDKKVYWLDVNKHIQFWKSLGLIVLTISIANLPKIVRDKKEEYEFEEAYERYCETLFIDMEYDHFEEEFREKFNEYVQDKSTWDIDSEEFFQEEFGGQSNFDEFRRV